MAEQDRWVPRSPGAHLALAKDFERAAFGKLLAGCARWLARLDPHELEAFGRTVEALALDPPRSAGHAAQVITAVFGDRRRFAAFVNGGIPPSDLDDEELDALEHEISRRGERRPHLQHALPGDV